MNHHLCHQIEALLIFTTTYHQKTCHKVQTLSVAHVREVECYLFENLLKPLDVLSVTKVGEFRKSAGYIFGNLSKARVMLGDGGFPKVFLGDGVMGVV